MYIHLAFYPSPTSIHQSLCMSASSSSSSTCSLGREKEFALNVAFRAASICHEAVQNMSVRRKDDNTPVSAADYAIQTMVTKTLAGVFPDDVLIAEEDISDPSVLNDELLWHEVNRLSNVNDDARLILKPTTTTTTTTDKTKIVRQWCLDPIDGTKGFISGGQYAMGLAILPQSPSLTPPLAILSLPASNNILLCDTQTQTLQMYDIHQNPSTLNENNKPLQSQFNQNINNNNIWHFSGSLKHFKLDDFPPWMPLCSGSLVKYVAVATQRAITLVQALPKGHAHVWDHASGIAAVIAAGGSVSDEFGNHVMFSGTKVHIAKNSHAIVATAPGIDHHQICKLVVKGFEQF